MAEAYISELGDSLSHGVANTNGDRVKIIAPKLYNDGNGNHLSIATALSGKAASNHTHTTSIASDSSSGTVVTLAHNTQYKLTAGGTSVLFKTPADSNTDTKVTQTADNSSTGTGFELLFSATADNTTRTEGSRKSSKLTFQPSTGTLTATKFSGPLTGNVTGNCSGSSGSCTGNAATATTATTAFAAKPGSDLENAINGKQPGRLVVTLADNSAFSKISAAIAAGKDVLLNTNVTDSGATYSHYVPLTEAVFRSGEYTAFIFARPRAYGDENGIVDKWTCDSSGWQPLDASYAKYAETAGVASSAGTANSASNANLGKTTDTTNGDLLYIGGGTQQRVTNAAHATSAKDYDQVGGIATAINLKQNALVFTNPASSNPGTISNPAVDKAYLDMQLGTSFVHAVNTNWVKYVFNNPTPVDSGTLVDIDDLMVKAGTTRQVTWYSSSYGTCTLTPGYTTAASGRKQYKQYIPYEITIVNLTSTPIVVEVAAGGRYGQSVNPNNGFKGHISVDGLTKDTPQGELPSQWTWGWVNALQIGSVPASGSRTWRLWWSDYVDPNNPGTYHTHSVFVTTIK